MLFGIMLAIVVVLTIVCLAAGGPEAGVAGLVLGLWLSAFVGWVANIVALTHAPAIALWTATELLRAFGIIALPLGSVLGYI